MSVVKQFSKNVIGKCELIFFSFKQPAIFFLRNTVVKKTYKKRKKVKGIVQNAFITKSSNYCKVVTLLLVMITQVRVKWNRTKIVFSDVSDVIVVTGINIADYAGFIPQTK